MADSSDLNINWALGTPKAESSVVAEKKARLQETAIQKQALYGSPEEQRAIATADLMDNRLADDRSIQDIWDLNPNEYAAKYGDEAEKSRWGYRQTYRDVQDLKNAVRSGKDVTKDSMIDAGLMATNTVGGVVALGANAVDQMAGTTASPMISQGLDWLNQKGQSAQSDLMQERRQQHSLEGELDSLDRDARFKERLQKDPESVLPWLKKQGEALVETVGNYADDPIMAGSLVPEGVGSLIPSTLGIRAVGRANALRTLAGRGMSQKEARDFLKTSDGKQLLEEQAVRAAPLVIGATETGGAVHQSQLDILSLSEDELSKSEDYQALRNQGSSHEDAQMQLARDAGTVAGISAAPGALIAGRIAAPFAANPLRTGAGRSVTGGARNLASETVEEGLQEANSQVSTNIGARSIGLDRSLDEGVAEAAAQGALGGIATAGPLQTPGVVLGTAGELGSAAVAAGKQAVTASEDRTKARLDDASTVGTRAREEAAVTMEAAGQTMLEGLRESSAQSETNPTQTEPAYTKEEGLEVEKTLESGLFVPVEEIDGIGGLEEIRAFREKNPEAPVRRSMAVESMGRMFQDRETGKDMKTMLAVGMLDHLNEMRRMDSTVVSKVALAQEKDSQILRGYEVLKKDLAVQEASNVVKEAREFVGTLTLEEVRSTFQVEALKDPETPAEVRAGIIAALNTVAQVNPELLSQEDYNLAYEQVGSGKNAERLKRNLKMAQQIAQEFQQADLERAEIQKTQAKALKKGEKGHRTWDMVRKDINVDGNRNNRMPSLNEHRRRVTEAATAGRIEEAEEALGELVSFAESQASKMSALNESFRLRKGRDEPVGYDAYGPYGSFRQEGKNGVFVDIRYANSIALAQEVYVDAKAAANLVKALSDGFGMDVAEVRVPAPPRQLTLAANALATQPTTPTPDAETAPSATAEPVASGVQSRKTREKEEPKSDPEIDGLLEGLKNRKSGKAQPATSEQADAPVTQEDEETPDEADNSPDETSEPEATDETEEAAIVEAEPEAEPEASVGWFEGLKERLLKRSDGFNVFLNAFRQMKRGASLTDHADPMEWLQENLETIEASDEVKAALSATIRETFPDFAGEFENQVSALIGRVTKKNSIEDALSYANGLPLNFMVQAEDGTRYIEPRVMAATFAATYEWLLAYAGPRPKMDDEQINKMFGRPRGSSISPEMRESAMHGISQQAAVETISTKIMDLLDVRGKDDETIRHTQGLFRSMALSALEIWTTPGTDAKGSSVPALIETSSLDYASDGSTRTMLTLRPRADVAEDADVAVLRKWRDPFTRIFTEGRIRPRHIGEPPATLTDTQIGNRLAKLSKQERKAVKRLQETPSYINMPMIDLIGALGEATFTKILGFTELSDEAKFSKDHRRSIEGKNQTLQHDLDGAMAYVQETREFAQDLDVGEVPIYHEWQVSSVGRLQQIGPVTPQGSKIVREMLASTNSVLDLESPAHQDALWLAVAQSIGVKIESLSKDDAIDKAAEMMTDPAALGGAVTMIQEWMNGGALDGAAFQRLLVASKEEVSPKMIHAVLTVARANESKGTPEGSSFRTALALEADGKTDGPVNAMVHMGTGKFSPKQIERFAKGGFFFTSQPISLNDFIDLEYAQNANRPGFKRGEDLYHMAAALFEKRLSQSIKENSGEDQLRVLRVLDSFVSDFSLGVPSEDGTYSPDIGRKVTKNPLTVFLYGSGDRGIAGKIAGEVIDGLSVMLSEIAQSGKRVSEHPMLVENPSLVADLGEMLFPNNPEEIKSWLQKPLQSQVSGRMQDALTDAILKYYAEPMLEAVNEATGGLQQNMKFTQSVASIQTVIFQDVFRKKISAAQQAKEAKEPGSRSKALLSENEIRDLFAETMDIAPIYGTDIQNFHIAAPSKAMLDKLKNVDGTTSDIRVAQSLSGKQSVRASYIEPADASVKVSPYLTIGTGDGRMIMNIYLNGDGSLDTSLPVFDGVELAVDQIDAGSRQINENVFKGWMEGNPYEAIADGFDQLMAYLDKDSLDSLDPETFRQLGRSLGLEKGQTATMQDLQRVQSNIRGLAHDAADRKAAMKKLASSTDHMAGAQAPHVNGGAVTDTDSPLDYAAISELLEGFRLLARDERELRDETKRNVQKVSGYAQAPNAGFAARLREIGTPVEGYEDVLRVKGKAVLSLLSRDTGTSADQKGVIQSLNRLTGVSEEMEYFFGSPDALGQLRKDMDLPAQDRPIELGLIYPGRNVSFIGNASPETLVHEMLHSYTAKLLSQHYRNPTASPEHVKFAVSRLDELMGDVLSLTTADISDYDASALRILQETLSDPKLADRPDVRMSELVSYMLSNPDLIEKGKKTKTYRPLMSLVQKGLELVKRLLGIRVNLGNTLYSNIRANTELLIMREPSPELEAIQMDAEVDAILAQAYGSDPRIEEIERVYLGRLFKVLEGVTDTNDIKVVEAGVSRKLLMAERSAELAVSAGFTLSAREAAAFAAVHATVSSGLKSNEPVQRHLYEAFSHVAKTLTPEDFLKVWGKEQSATARDMVRARKMRDYLIGAQGLRASADGRSDMLATFIALTQTNGDLRQALGRMAPPKSVELKWNSVDDWMRSLGTSMINLISRISLKPRRMAPDLRREMDLLSKTLTEVQGSRRLLAALDRVSALTDKANEAISGRVAKASETISDDLLKRAKKTSNKYLGGALQAGALVSAFGSKEAFSAHGEAYTTMLNHAPGMNTLRSLLTELRGMTDSNTPVMRLINPVKAQIDALRQDFREGVPEELAKAFSRPLKREEWSRMHKGIAQADILALGHQVSIDLLKDPASVGSRIADLEEQIGAIDRKRADRYKMKARMLANVMVGNQPTTQHLLRNAHAIAHLYGERDGVSDPSADLVEAIDKLTSLYAFELLDPAVVQTLSALMDQEPSGMQTVTGFLNTTRAMELQRRDRDGAVNEVARNNGWKGYVPSLTQEGASLIVAEDTEYDALVRRGYTRVGDYEGDANEGRKEKRGYYQSTVGGRAAFRQGIAQTVHETWQGVDARTGRTQPGKTAGMVLGKRAQAIAKGAERAAAGSLDDVVSGEYLLPILDAKGKVVAYERSMDPARLEALPKDEHLGRMLGIWSGRILEEGAADEFNSVLVQTLKDVHVAALEEGREDEFINMADPDLDDPVAKDAWDGLGWRIKEEIQEAFGPGQFPIRLDMRDDALGYRAASVTDPWTGISRWSDETQEKLRKAAEFIFKEDAFKRMNQGEKLVTDVVSYAKTTIIVRSLVVGVGNIMSNFLHLAMKGVSIDRMVQGSRDKFTEITEYVKNREEIQALQVKMGAVLNDKSQSNILRARIQALQEANDRMSIAPLLKAGEFSTISENLTEADVAIREGRWGDYLEKAVDKLPGWGSTAAKNLLITKDTALFQGMNRIVQYGDFVAKAVLYDHLTQKKGLSEREALDQILEEFVNYNRLPGRGRDFLESMGLLWFWNYKVRIMKVMANTIRERPLNSLLMMGGIGPQTGIQSVWDGSLVGAGLDGRLDYSIGPEMGFQAPFMHPVWSMAT